MSDELINGNNFMEIFTRALKKLTRRVGEAMPLHQFTDTEIIMLGLASCCGFVVVDSTLDEKSWIRLTPAGQSWLKNPIPLEQIKMRAPRVIE